jgi:predicted nuclease of predicted toxin-antitoxin system
LKLYLDQMFKIDVADALRSEGNDVIRASDVGQSRAEDNEILAKAISEDRILITLDEHFGDWTVLPLSKHPGVIRLKINPTTSRKAIDLLLPFLFSNSEEQFRNRLIILAENRVKWVATS